MWVNSLWHCDTILQHRSRPTLAQVMACCLATSSHYLNQCWLRNNEVLWHSFESNFTASAQATMNYNSGLYSWHCYLLKYCVTVIIAPDCICVQTSKKNCPGGFNWKQVQQYWSRLEVGAKQTTNHYLNQWWLSCITLEHHQATVS